LSRADYERVINAYKRVYLESPTSAKADPSVVASAELMEEQGRRFQDDAVLRAAIHQYEFLRQQYPGSKARFNALFRIGEIYQDDLHDKQHADEAFQQFLHLYPHNRLAAQARQEMAQPVVKASLKAKEKENLTEADDSGEKADDEDANVNDKPLAGAHGFTRVTGIHHWSTPDSTRVAVDVAGEVKFVSQRIENPDRIFFDLLDTSLNRDLLGKTYEVNDGVVKEIRISQFKPGRTRVVFEVEKVSGFKASLESDPPRLLIELRNRQIERAANDGGTKTADITAQSPSDRVADTSDDTIAGRTDVGNELETNPKSAKTSVSATPDGVKRRIVDADDDDETASKPRVAKPNSTDIGAAKETSPTPIRAATSKGRSTKRHGVPIDDEDAHEAQPTAAGDRSLIRALDLKIGKIVIDPGHGGHDTGTIGPNGLEEKDLVLDVSKRLGRLLETRLGAQVVYTRKDDTFIPLEERTAIANREGADLFVSIHANSSSDPDARGVETYYLNFTSSRDALEVAARENAVSEKSIHELQDLVKTIALKEKIEESREFATDVEFSLHKGLAAKSPGIRDRGVKKAPFIVLIGANMPSILAEISFVSNPGDERRLETSDYRQRIAESLYRGIAKYVNGLSGVKVASKVDKEQGQ
jgi:N-acetylmuramoyl-L-alanine amidase